MELSVNGARQSLPEGATVGALLALLGMESNGVAVAVNRQVVPRSDHAEHSLCAGDRVEVIRAVGGG